MNESGFNKLFWGFFFILINIRINGFDLLPDIIGYILFAIGLSQLAHNSIYFEKAKNFNIPRLILSLFSIYEQPAQNGEFSFGQFGWFSLLISIAALILSLLVMYNLFLGIKEMANSQAKPELFTEADNRWKQYLYLQIIAMAAYIIMFIPFLAIIFIIGLVLASIVIMVGIMRLLKRCSEEFAEIERGA